MTQPAPQDVADLMAKARERDEQAAKINPGPSEPYKAAKKLRDDHWRNSEGDQLLKYLDKDWWQYTGTHWEIIDTDQVRTVAYQHFEDAQYATVDPKTGVPVTQAWKPTAAKINNVVDALKSVVLDTATVPETRLVSVNNGLLDPATMTLHPHTPTVFTVTSAPFDYDPDAQAPAWNAFLQELLPGDPDAIELLRQWFGYVLTAQTAQQKMLMIVGPPRAGKGIIGRVLTALLGKDNVASPTLAGLAENFGLWPLIGKSLGIVGDARISGGDPRLVERLLSISGEDQMTVDRKYQAPWTGRMTARLMLLTNVLPRLGDASSALANRFLIVQLHRSWLGNEDTELEGRLTAEMPGILTWALGGLATLQNQGRFTVPESSRVAVDSLNELSSPIVGFINDECVIGEDLSVAKSDLYFAWTRWCEANGHVPGSAAVFGRNLAASLTRVRAIRAKVDGKRVHKYVGIALDRSGSGVESGQGQGNSPLPLTQQNPSTTGQNEHPRTLGQGGQGKSENYRVTHARGYVEKTMAKTPDPPDPRQPLPARCETCGRHLGAAEMPAGTCIQCRRIAEANKKARAS